MSSYVPPLTDAYLQYLAQSVSHDPSLYDDLVQEGRIKQWQAWNKEPGKPRQYYVVAVKRRMLGLCMGTARFTGFPGRRGYVDAMSPKHSPLSSTNVLLDSPEFDERRLRPAVAASKIMRTADVKAWAST